MDSSRIVRDFVTCLLVVAAPATAWAAKTVEKYTLQPDRKPGEIARVEIALQVGGDLKLADDGKTKTVPMSVVANLKYDERLLAVDQDGLPTRSARYYDEARAVIKVDRGGEKPELAATHRLIAVEKLEKQPAVLYSPAEPLSREELDLLDVQANTLLLDRFLPTEPVALGGSWKLSDEVLCGLLGLEAVSWSDVQCVLGEVKDGVADIAAAGSVSGAVGGVSTEIELKVKARVVLSTRRIGQFAILVKEKRAVGHVGPGLDTVAKVLVKITPVASSTTLTAEALKTIPAKFQRQAADLRYASQPGRFTFDYDRRWYLTSDDAKLAIWRLLDRGELVAQCNMSALVGKEKPLTLAEFQRDVEQSLGKNFGQFTKATESRNEAGYRVYRVVVQGTVSELPIEWVYYLVQDEKGRGVTLAFTYEQELEGRFAQADSSLVARLRLLEPATPTAARAVRNQ